MTMTTVEMKMLNYKISEAEKKITAAQQAITSHINGILDDQGAHPTNKTHSVLIAELKVVHNELDKMDANHVNFVAKAAEYSNLEAGLKRIEAEVKQWEYAQSATVAVQILVKHYPNFDFAKVDTLLQQINDLKPKDADYQGRVDALNKALEEAAKDSPACIQLIRINKLLINHPKKAAALNAVKEMIEKDPDLLNKQSSETQGKIDALIGKIEATTNPAMSAINGEITLIKSSKPNPLEQTVTNLEAAIVTATKEVENFTGTSATKALEEAQTRLDALTNLKGLVENFELIRSKLGTTDAIAAYDKVANNLATLVDEIVNTKLTAEEVKAKIEAFKTNAEADIYKISDTHDSSTGAKIILAGLAILILGILSCGIALAVTAVALSAVSGASAGAAVVAGATAVSTAGSAAGTAALAATVTELSVATALLGTTAIGAGVGYTAIKEEFQTNRNKSYVNSQITAIGRNLENHNEGTTATMTYGWKKARDGVRAVTFNSDNRLMDNAKPENNTNAVLAKHK